MKVTHILNRFWPARGGMESQAFALAKAQERAGLRVSVHTTDSLGELSIRQLRLGIPPFITGSSRALIAAEKLEGVDVERHHAWLRIGPFHFASLDGNNENSDVLHLHSPSDLVFN